MCALRDIIDSKKLYDEKNPFIVICDKDLETAINMKALHMADMKYDLTC